MAISTVSWAEGTAIAHRETNLWSIDDWGEGFTIFWAIRLLQIFGHIERLGPGLNCGI